MSTIASQITSLTIVYSTIYSGVDQSKHQSSASLAFVWGIHRGPVNSPHKWPVTRKMFPFDDVIMLSYNSPVLFNTMQHGLAVSQILIVCLHTKCFLSVKPILFHPSSYDLFRDIFLSFPPLFAKQLKSYSRGSGSFVSVKLQRQAYLMRMQILYALIVKTISEPLAHNIHTFPHHGVMKWTRCIPFTKGQLYGALMLLP